jgi:hypothetical protein
MLHNFLAMMVIQFYETQQERNEQLMSCVMSNGRIKNSRRLQRTFPKAFIFMHHAIHFGNQMVVPSELRYPKRSKMFEHSHHQGV